MAQRTDFRHGDEAGAARHRRRGEKACKECRAGAARANADRKRQRQQGGLNSRKQRERDTRIDWAAVIERFKADMAQRYSDEPEG